MRTAPHYDRVVTTLGDVLAQGARAQLVGRDDELGRLVSLLVGERPAVVHVHGPAGIGKTALVDAAVAAVAEAGCTVVRLDGAAVEPTPAGFTSALAAALGDDPGSPAADLVGRLADGPVVLVVDRYERLRLVDSWLRQTFLPMLPDTVRVLLAGRDAPLAPWWTSPGWSEVFHRLPLAPLGDDAARALLRDRGVHEGVIDDLVPRARGLPLALVLAAAGPATSPTGGAEADLLDRVFGGLLDSYLADLDPGIRTLVESAAIPRRLTLPVLAAVLEGDADEAVLAFERLRELPFTEDAADGLALHELVQEAVASAVRARDPRRFRELQRRAWARIRNEAASAPSSELWRYTADMLWLIANPVLREAFFPSGSDRLVIERARADDRAAIESIIDRHEADAGALGRWMRDLPDAVYVVRDAGGTVAGAYLLAEAGEVPAAIEQHDVITRRWLEDLRRDPVRGGQRCLLFRRWLGADVGDAPGAVQAASWLDVKRTYLELRPALRRIYTVTTTPEPYLPVVTQLGFRPVPDACLDVAGVPHTSVALDFGPGSVDGWLGRLAAQEIGVIGDELLDPERRELLLDGNRIELTRLEFGLLAHLEARQGQVVTREELLAAVWGYERPVGSNVVDAVVRTVRRKLGGSADRLVTVRGHGYRLER